MMKILITIIIAFASISIKAQCNTKTTLRPDGNTITYFNPKPIIRQAQYEVGTAIYKNETTGIYLVNISVLFKAMLSDNITGNLTIQTTGKKAVELKLVKSEQVEMNGKTLSIGLYGIDKNSFEELKKYPLKSMFFYLDGKRVGATVTESKNVFMTQLNCIK
ncbi:MAG: hypothetical protein ACK4IZ_02215 [Flavobacterium sp.]|uniref:hypothetical protein n=1 Tax=Flavobacterium sp. TaxID=239 RepID=UPI0039187ECD